MDEFVVIILFVFFALIVPPVVLFVIIYQLKKNVHTLSSQFSDLSRRMEKIIEVAGENREKENAGACAVPPVTTPPLPVPGTTSPEREVEKVFLPFSMEEDPILLSEEDPTESMENYTQSDPVTEEISLPEITVTVQEETTPIHRDTEQVAYRYAAEKRVSEEPISFGIHKPVSASAREATRKEGIFSSRSWGENLLPKIGIITFVLGIAFFVKYAIDQDWINETGRVGIGLLTGIAIIGIGHKLRAQYDVFSSILSGGGFAVFYITLTLAFREYELIPQSLAFALLVMVTVACVVLSVFYDQKELALFSLLGGFAAPFLVSTGSGSYIVLFSYILILNTGMIWLAFRKGWYLIGTVCFALSQLVIWSWLLSSFYEIYISMPGILLLLLFLLLFFVQFHVLTVADHLRKRSKFTPTQAVMLLANNLSLCAAGIFIFSDYPVQLNGLITMGLAVLNTITLLAVFRDKRIDQSLKYLLVATILSFVTLAIPLQLDGYVITLLWSAEIVIVLVLWLRSHRELFRFGLYAIIALAAISYVLDIREGYETIVSEISPDGLEIAGARAVLFLNRYFITGVALVIACIASAWLLKKELNKESAPQETDIHRKHLSQLFRFFYLSIYVVSFVVLYVELYNQFTKYEREEFHMLVMATYFYLFAAMAIFLNRRKLEAYDATCTVLVSLLGLYATVYFYILAEVRELSYLYNSLSTSGFYIHLLSLVAAGYLIWQVWQYSLRKEVLWRTRYVWILTVCTVIIVTRESDNLAILAVGNSENYFGVLHGLRTFGYPILWGILAMCLMTSGLKRKDILLRKISLIFFAFIVAKFYLYDVWQMSQGGRIVSFVVLGLILLVVSFMQQRIRKLVKEDKQEDTETEEP